MKYLIFLLFLLSFNVFAETLTKEENIFFNFIDLNNDSKISYQEVDQSMKLIFKLLDENSDNIISKEEILKLKSIIEILS